MFKFMKIFGVVLVLVFVGNVQGAVLVSRDNDLLIANGYVTISSFFEIQAYAGGGGIATMSAYNDYDFRVYNAVTDANEFPLSKFYFTTTAKSDNGILFLSAFDNAGFGSQYYVLLLGYARGPASLNGVPIENIYGVNDINEDNIIGYVNWGTGSLIFGGDGDVTIDANDLIMDNVRGNLNGLNGGVYDFYGTSLEFTISPMVYSPIWCNYLSDFNGDCIVNLLDFAILSNEWMTTYSLVDLVNLSNEWMSSVPTIP